MARRYWKVVVHRKAEKTLKRLRGHIRRRVLEALHALEKNPRPSDVKKMKGRKSELYRVRVGDWRIIYQIQDEKLIVLMLTIAPRDPVYKNR